MPDLQSDCFMFLRLLFLSLAVNLGLFHILHSPPVMANSICATINKPAPRITIRFAPEKLDYDFTKTTLEMITEESGSRDQWLKAHGIDPKGVHPDTPILTNGLYRSAFGRRNTILSFGSVPVDSYTVYYCPYIEQLEIVFRHRAKIIMPTEIKAGTCEHKEKIKHHQKYYDLAVAAGNNTVHLFNQDIEKILHSIYNATQPLDKSLLGQGRNEIRTKIRDAMEIYFQSMKNNYNEGRAVNESDESFSHMANAIKACEEGLL